jgi:uncharacterized CHY-type Zn-finger protein
VGGAGLGALAEVCAVSCCCVLCGCVRQPQQGGGVPDVWVGGPLPPRHAPRARRVRGGRQSDREVGQTRGMHACPLAMGIGEYSTSAHQGRLFVCACRDVCMGVCVCGWATGTPTSACWRRAGPCSCCGRAPGPRSARSAALPRRAGPRTTALHAQVCGPPSHLPPPSLTSDGGWTRTPTPTHTGDIELSADDLAATHTPTGELGCGHYKRACKLRAECCGRLFTCRLCHDEANPDHAMDRYAVKDVLCMRCGTLQPVGQYCRSQACKGERGADPRQRNRPTWWTHARACADRLGHGWSVD